jgi:nicotinamide riboside transporter PnuC
MNGKYFPDTAEYFLGGVDNYQLFVFLQRMVSCYFFGVIGVWIYFTMPYSVFSH